MVTTWDKAQVLLLLMSFPLALWLDVQSKGAEYFITAIATAHFGVLASMKDRKWQYFGFLCVIFLISLYNTFRLTQVWSTIREDSKTLVWPFNVVNAPAEGAIEFLMFVRALLAIVKAPIFALPYPNTRKWANNFYLGWELFNVFSVVDVEGPGLWASSIFVPALWYSYVTQITNEQTPIFLLSVHGDTHQLP